MRGETAGEARRASATGGSARAVGIVIATFLALPIAYVFSIGPVAWMCTRHGPPTGMCRSSGPLETFYSPLRALEGTAAMPALQGWVHLWGVR